jgi:hypothetical protein
MTIEDRDVRNVSPFFSAVSTQYLHNHLEYDKHLTTFESHSLVNLTSIGSSVDELYACMERILVFEIWSGKEAPVAALAAGL